MKFNLRTTGVIIFIFLFLILSSFSEIDAVEIDDNEKKLKSEARVSVRAEIPLFQMVEIIQEPNIDYSALMENYNGSREIVIEEALILNILSNADWNLRLNNRNLDFKVMIKKSNQSDYEWQNLNSTTAKFRGENGVEQLTFDLKFILNQNNRTTIDNLALDLRHSLSPKLY